MAFEKEFLEVVLTIHRYPTDEVIVVLVVFLSKKKVHNWCPYPITPSPLYTCSAFFVFSGSPTRNPREIRELSWKPLQYTGQNTNLNSPKSNQIPNDTVDSPLHKSASCIPDFRIIQIFSILYFYAILLTVSMSSTYINLENRWDVYTIYISTLNHSYEI